MKKSYLDLSIQNKDNSWQAKILGGSEKSIFCWLVFNDLTSDSNFTQYILNFNNETSVNSTYNENRFTLFAKYIDDGYYLQMSLYYKTYNFLS